MPVGEEPWKAYDIGRLATLFRTDTRQLARSKQPDLAPFLKAADPTAGLIVFRDGPWSDPAATMFGSAQESWLAHALAASVGRGQRWQVVGSGTVMGRTRTPDGVVGWLGPDADERVKARVRRGVAAAKVGLPSNLDAWDGYPAARSRFLAAAQAADANLIVVSGDSHNAWAYDLANAGRAAGVEFAGQAVTSPGYEGAFSADPRAIAAALIAKNPELKWCDMSRRGYMALTLTPDRVSNTWVFADTVLARNPAANVGHTATIRRGARTMTA
ncbi:MAG: alkaline phosphatase D family protein, partial [Pseudomonadota bacterium]